MANAAFSRNSHISQVNDPDKQTYHRMSEEFRVSDPNFLRPTTKEPNTQSVKKESHMSPKNPQLGVDPSFSLTTFDFQLTNKHSNSVLSHIESEEKCYEIEHFTAQENIAAEHSSAKVANRART